MGDSCEDVAAAGTAKTHLGTFGALPQRLQGDGQADAMKGVWEQNPQKSGDAGVNQMKAVIGRAE